MFDYAILALTLVGSGAALTFAAAIVVLAATPEANEERPARFASRAMARLWRSARGGSQRPSDEPFKAIWKLSLSDVYR